MFCFSRTWYISQLVGAYSLRWDTILILNSCQRDLDLPWLILPGFVDSSWEGVNKGYSRGEVRGCSRKSGRENCVWDVKWKSKELISYKTITKVLGRFSQFIVVRLKVGIHVYSLALLQQLHLPNSTQLNVNSYHVDFQISRHCSQLNIRLHDYWLDFIDELICH